MPFSCPVPPRYNDAVDQMKWPRARACPVFGSLFLLRILCAKSQGGGKPEPPGSL
jgi:hypothetical protein